MALLFTFAYRISNYAEIPLLSANQIGEFSQVEVNYPLRHRMQLTSPRVTESFKSWQTHGWLNLHLLKSGSRGDVSVVHYGEKAVNNCHNMSGKMKPQQLWITEYQRLVNQLSEIIKSSIKELDMFKKFPGSTGMIAWPSVACTLSPETLNSQINKIQIFGDAFTINIYK